jgi:hypothetical protein
LPRGGKQQGQHAEKNPRGTSMFAKQNASKRQRNQKKKGKNYPQGRTPQEDLGGELRKQDASNPRIVLSNI